jgi:hypothetical protein
VYRDELIGGIRQEFHKENKTMRFSSSGASPFSPPQEP